VLSRLRLWEQYTEIEDSELRFNDAEAQAYFARSVTPPVNTRDIPQLMTLTEGWVAGMKIAALSPRRHDAMPGIGGVLSGGSRSISRYLEEVIFAPLPASVLHFLMLTSLLNRLHPALCDAVTGLNNGKEMLAWIEQHNLFLSALDEAGFWFRYHPLMRDALSHRLQQDATIDIRQLHERAGNWFAAQQLWAEAIRHALAAGSRSPDMQKPGHNHWRKKAISTRWCAGSTICLPRPILRALNYSSIWPGRWRTIAALATPASCLMPLRRWWRHAQNISHGQRG
jgi:LuxR family maltose regulon positive regulatory protein